MISFELETTSFEPKYIQLAEGIINEIKTGKLRLNDKLPSVNTYSSELNVSRETVFKALNHLSQKGIIKSVNRKGYFVQTTNLDIKLRLFLLLDKMTVFKKELYDALYESLHSHGELDVYFHHHNFTFFKKIIEENIQNYTHFIVVTYLKEDPGPVLKNIPPGKGIILDCYEEAGLKGFSMIYQDFAKDVFNALVNAEAYFGKYDRLVLIAPEQLYHAHELAKGFNEFLQDFGMPGKIITSISPEEFKRGTLYITVQVNDVDEVEIIKLARKNNFKIGQDIGILSYNDEPVKEVLEGGISVITTDFQAMGRKAAELILSGKKSVEINPSKLIIRSSI